jgi:hypothetical protein
MPRNVAMVGMGVLFAVIVVQIIVQIAAPVDNDQDLGDAVAFPDQGRRHLVAGDAFSLDQYNSFPPTSGPQAEIGVAPGIYGSDEPAPFNDTPEYASLLPILEQGGIVIYYDPALLETSTIDGLKSDVSRLREGRPTRPDFARPIVVLTPIDGENSDGAALYATAWRHVFAFEQAEANALRRIGVGDSDALENFVVTFYQRFLLEDAPLQSTLGSAE